MDYKKIDGFAYFTHQSFIKNSMMDANTNHRDVDQCQQVRVVGFVRK
jgi:hypothetical protein